MPRIRTIKPEFFGDEKFAPMSVIDRFVFLGLMTMADDAGRLLDNVKSIDGFIFPETDDTSRESLVNLARLSRISRYTVASGQRIIQIVNWTKHQKVDRPSTYVLPPEVHAEPSRDTRETLDNSSRSDLGPRTKDLGPRSMDPDLGAGSATNGAHAPPLAKAKRPTKPKPEPPDWAVRIADRWITRVGAVAPALVAKSLAPFVKAHGEVAILRAIDAFADAKAESGTTTPRFAWFVEGASAWVDRTTPKLAVDPATGLPNERGMHALTRAL